ncbi:hypothetical protein GCM10017083_39940 [Thalassobaculum fulvum]|uniref:Methyltransferase domain-containing protein n=1 Tax=Thalassobaculum fulvum TaxID=1633335 RepID=A0A919CR80_9PROT|nr:methyltransferase domain-containing protein [Thalassobaculum fulvum]GHD57895.1 hypothetical protein GCM10017083_39940 [Thalassobaculum fulvum]
MDYSGLTEMLDESNPHLGGNMKEGSPFTFAPTAWDYLIRRFALRSVMDLGSGLGYAAHYFHKQGLQVVAVDGLSSNVERAIYPTVLADLTRTAVHCRVDLVHCQEVVEHVDEKYLENVLASLACGKLILMTAATPGQGGYHHVNEQPLQYWVDHLKRHRCEVLPEDTRRVRRFAQADGALHLARTGLLFANRSL